MSAWVEEEADDEADGVTVGRGLVEEAEPEEAEDVEAMGFPEGRPSGDRTEPVLRGSPVVLGRGGGERLGPVSGGGAIRR